jgi:hypothetical protein
MNRKQNSCDLFGIEGDVGLSLTCPPNSGRMARALDLNFGCPSLRFLKAGAFDLVPAPRIGESCGYPFWQRTRKIACPTKAAITKEKAPPTPH